MHLVVELLLHVSWALILRHLRTLNLLILLVLYELTYLYWGVFGWIVLTPRLRLQVLWTFSQLVKPLAWEFPRACFLLLLVVL
jgi:hypothetical protein